MDEEGEDLNEKCPKGCVYHFNDRPLAHSYCQYILITGHCRPCPPGKDCTAYKRGKPLLPKPVAASPRKPLAQRGRPHLTHGELTAQAETLRQLRREAGLTQPEAARAAQVSRQTYQRWEYGKHAANWKLLENVFPGCAERYEKQKETVHTTVHTPFTPVF